MEGNKIPQMEGNKLNIDMEETKVYQRIQNLMTDMAKAEEFTCSTKGALQLPLH